MADEQTRKGGRPTTPAPNRERITVTILPDLIRRSDEFAAAQRPQVSRSAVVELALEAFLKGQPQAEGEERI